MEADPEVVMEAGMEAAPEAGLEAIPEVPEAVPEAILEAILEAGPELRRFQETQRHKRGSGGVAPHEYRLVTDAYTLPHS